MHSVGDVIGKSHRSGEEGKLESNPCEHCYPTCHKCGCWGANMYCSCFEFNHECECHEAEYVDRRLDCDNCGPKQVEEYIQCSGYHWRFGNRLQKEMRRRLKEFKGTYAEQKEMLKGLRDRWNNKYDAACMTTDEQNAWKTVRTRPIFKGKKSDGGMLLQRRMWETLVPKSVIRKFPNVQDFIKYTVKFKKDGMPKRLPKL